MKAGRDMAKRNDRLYYHEPFTRADGREGYLVSDPETGAALGWHPPQGYGNALERAVQSSGRDCMTLLPVRNRAVPQRGAAYVYDNVPTTAPVSGTPVTRRLAEPGQGVMHSRETCPACHRARGRDLDIRLPAVPSLDVA